MSGKEEAAGNRHACAACKHQRKKCPATCPMAPHFPAENMNQFQEVVRVFGLASVAKIIRHLNFQEQEEAIKSMKWEASLWTKNPIYGPYGEFKRLELELNLLKQDLNVRSVSPQPPLVIDNKAWRRENSSYVLVPVKEDHSVNFNNNNNNNRNIVLESSLNNNGSFTSRGQGRGYQAVGPSFVQDQTHRRDGPLSGPHNFAPILLGIGHAQAVGRIGYNGGVFMGAGGGDRNNEYPPAQKREEGKEEDLTDFYSQHKSTNY